MSLSAQFEFLFLGFKLQEYMILIPGYTTKEEVFSSSSKIALRAIRNSDAMPVILKMSKQTGFGSSSSEELEQEFQLLSSLATKDVLEGISKLTLENRCLLELEDFEGVNLADFLADNKLSFLKKLHVAVQLATFVEYLHRNGILHRDLRPLHFLVHPSSLEMKCVDLSTACALHNGQTNSSLQEKFLSGREYLAPEQTGRIALKEDVRTDLYSLGILFYFLFTGHVPFHSEDMNELIHAHLAKQPAHPQSICPELPDMLSLLLLTLLEKKPDARYQTAKGLRFDLLKCLYEYRTKGEIESFTISKKEESGTFKLSEGFYGREADLESLLHSIKWAKERSTVVWISGPSGIGKSTFVEEARKRLPNESAFFITGKCEQHLQHLPYGAVTKALRQLIHVLLCTSLTEQQEWKKKILHAVEEAGQLIIDEIPELEVLLGKQPPVTNVPAADAANRNLLVFTHFMDVFASSERPLIMFLDDLQWADEGTLWFIQQACYGNKNRVIFAAYRSNEKTEALSLTIEELERKTIPIGHIELSPLTASQIREWLSEAFSLSDTDSVPLANVVFQNTLGNPLFVIEYLQSLLKEGSLLFDFSIKKWKWMIQKKGNELGAASSQELISRKIQKMSPSAIQALSFAACIGSSFDLCLLAALMDKTEHETAEEIKEAVEASLLVPKKNKTNPSDGNFNRKRTYSFLHDQVQQAAYALLEEELRYELHLNIGYRLLEKKSKAETDQHIFEIVGHLNKGKSLVKKEEDLFVLASLNMSAGKKAKSSSAFAVAYDYLLQALEDFNKMGSEEKRWNEHYDFALSLNMEAAEVAYLTGHYDISAKITHLLMRHVRTLREKTETHLLTIHSFIYQKENEKALTLGLQRLKALGVHFPTSPSSFHILSAFLKCKWILRGKQIENIANLPCMSHPEMLEAFRIIQALTATAYLNAPALYPLLVLKMVYLSIKYGNAPQSPLAYATYGAIVNAIQTDNQACYRWGNMAMQLVHKVNDPSLKERTSLVYHLINKVSKEHVCHSLEPLKDSLTRGFKSGEMEYAVYASNSYCLLLLLSGKNLHWVKEEMLHCNALPKTLKPEMTSTGNEALIQIVSNFLGENPNPTLLTGKYFDEEQGFTEIFKTNQKSKLFISHLYKFFFCYLLEEYTEGASVASEASHYLREAKGMLSEPQFYFYQALLHFALYSLHFKGKDLNKAKAFTKKVKKWAEQVPVNHSHRYHLLVAEYHKALKNEKQAVEQYDKAIRLANENNSPHEGALCNELAGKYWLQRGQKREAAIYLTRAIELYALWGCELKVHHLSQKYANILRATSLEQNIKGTSFHMGVGSDVHTFDLATLMKASTAISSEVVFDKLMEKLMKVVIENAGAQVGYFVLERFGQLIIEARQSVEQEKVQLLKIPLTDFSLLPKSLIAHVFATKDTLLIQDASQEVPFQEELSQLSTATKSILCIPTLNQGKLVGVLYLENNLATGAFTQDRVEILKLLAGQIAVSIENAILYENLEQKVEERTAKIQIQKEEIERQKQLVEEKSRYKEQFFANMSHEIRTPMTAIIGMSELIFGTPLSPKQTEYVKGIKFSSENLLAIINDILDYSKIEAGKFSFIKKPFQIRERMHRLRYILQCLAEEKGIELRIIVDERLSGQHIGDPLRLHQILLNLASNAIKFTDEGSVEIKVEKGSETDTKEELIFTVKDTGIGIPEEKTHYIFETFSQIESETSTQFSGTGLGLFIAKKLVEEQGGSMRVKSQLKKGTEFSFHLLFDTSSVYHVQKDKETIKNLEGIKILLVEDNLFNQVVAEDLLKIMIPDVQVTIANNGAIAVEKLENELYDIVLMDVKMPVMDGYRATSLIREKHITVPILALTANSNPMEAEKCRAAGMNDYISKPIESQKLKEKISKLVKEREQVLGELE